MGIRVDKDELMKQLEITGDLDRTGLLFHRRLLNDELPSSMGGGIGQSRTAMQLLKSPYPEIQSAAIWPGEMVDPAGEATSGSSDRRYGKDLR
jgi:aspartate--ammonia ligase